MVVGLEPHHRPIFALMQRVIAAQITRHACEKSSGSGIGKLRSHYCENVRADLIERGFGIDHARKRLISE
jgi:hypothetical protein